MTLNKWLPAVIGLVSIVPPVQAQVLIRQVPGFVVQPYATVTRSTTIIAPMNTVNVAPLAAPLEWRTNTSSAVVVESTLGSVSNFGHRLNMLRDQITAGEQQGLLDTGVAAGLLSRYQSLAGDLASDPAMTRDRYDAFEQQINLLNQDVSEAMTR